MAQAPPQLDVTDFFSGAEAGTDRWRQPSAAGRAWKATLVRGHADERLPGEAADLLSDVAVLEENWAYPGVAMKR
jgi:hypothetical protein